MGSLTYKNSPTPVGKVRISSTYIGTRENGDIVIELCTRFSYPNLYNCEFSGLFPQSPSQQIDILATSEDNVDTCCDLFKVSDQDLEFRMRLNLKNYDPKASKLYYDEEPTNTNDTTMIQDLNKTESEHIPKENQKFVTFEEEKDHNQSYLLFANCSNEDNEESIVATLDAVMESDVDEPDPLDTSNRVNEISNQDFNPDGTKDSISSICSLDDIVIKDESDIKLKPETVESNKKPKMKVPRVFSKAKGELYGFKDKIVERIRYKKAETRCVFCNTDVNHFSRHLLRKHPTEEDVIAFSSLPKEDRERSILIGIIRKKGNFSKISDNIISPVRRPREGKDGLSFMACPYCKGIYKAQYVRRHFKRCYMNRGLNKDPDLSCSTLARHRRTKVDVCKFIQ